MAVVTVQSLISGIANQDTIEFKDPVYVVERSFSSLGDPVIQDPHTTLFTLLTQFAGGLQPHNILYIGQDKKKAELICDTYTKAAIHAREVLEAE